MGSVVVVIKTNKLGSDFRKTGQKHKNTVRVIQLLRGLVTGALAGEVSVTSSTSDPVAATATSTITYASLVDLTDTFVAFGVTLTCVTGTPTALQWKKQTDATVTAANLVAAINANATMSKYILASSVAGVVTVTAKIKGSSPNFWTVISRAGTGQVLVQWAGGAGGSESTSEVMGW